MDVRAAASMTRDAARDVFSQPGYLVLAGFSAALLMLAAILLPNASLLAGSMPFGEKVLIAWKLLGGFETNFTPLSRAATVLLAVLFGVNISFLVFVLRSRAKSLAAAHGWWGAAVGLVGIGCASCGSVILASLFGTGLASAAIGALPLRGTEFQLVGIAGLIVGIAASVQKIRDPAVCGTE